MNFIPAKLTRLSGKPAASSPRFRGYHSQPGRTTLALIHVPALRPKPITGQFDISAGS